LAAGTCGRDHFIVRTVPSGTVSLLFTDVEGSTRLLREEGERYADLLAEHRRLLRGAFRRHDGVEVDTQGDAFFVAFRRASDAVRAAREAQLALGRTPVRVRVGIHTGEPLITEEGYVGVDVHFGARIAAAAHGGQILISQATRELLRDEFELHDLGTHRLKDLPGEERLYQVGEGEFPPPKTLFRTNLPIATTAFVGREREVVEVSALLADPYVRLLTLTGAGGSGKTRLALRAAEDRVLRYPDGMFWVGLAPLRDPQLVSTAIAESLGIEGDAAAQIANKRMLLLLDNFEHVLDAATELLLLLGACPHLDLLVTSRQRLRMIGEYVYAVPPMQEADAAALFAERAVAIRTGFTSDSRVSEICRRLDRLPLAIELAAARVDLFSPAAMLRRLDRRLRLVESGTRGATARQRTLRATIDWSYDLLSENEKQLFAQLAAFEGGFRLDAAEAICDLPGDASADVADTIYSLAERNLVTYSDDPDGEPRFGMLETIREYAQERLTDQQLTEYMADRHMEWYIGVAESTTVWNAPEVVGRDEQNVRAAVLRSAAANVRGSDLRLTQAWRALTNVAARSSRFADAAQAALKGLEHARRTGDAALESRVGAQYAFTALLGPTPVPEAIAQCEEALGDGWEGEFDGIILTVLGELRAMEGDSGAARELFMRGRRLAEDACGLATAGSTTACGAQIEVLAGDLAAAEQMLRHEYEALEPLAEDGLRSTIAARLAHITARRHNFNEATNFASIAEELAAKTGLPDDDFVLPSADIRGARARILAAAGHFEDAIAEAREGVTLTSRTDALNFQAEALVALSEVHDAAGREHDAHQARQSAIALYCQKGNAVAAEQVRAPIVVAPRD
jgi:predicted ATPase/class 3 adenylate cyclase